MPSAPWRAGRALEPSAAPQALRNVLTARLGRRTWPLPALLGWSLALLAHRQALAAGAGSLQALLLALAVSAGFAAMAGSRWRAALVMLGTPVLMAFGGGAPALPDWIWLMPALLLLWAYPASSWRDAPFFPTRRGTLDGLPKLLRLGSRATVLDAGCGLGHGMRALRRAFPQARVRGVERSLPLAWLCGRLCPWAEVRRGDMWAQSWRGVDLVYLFQRPETMPRAMDKARREMHPGAWMVSLEFEAEGWTPWARLQTPTGQPVWVYRMPALPTRRAGGARR